MDAAKNRIKTKMKQVTREKKECSKEHKAKKTQSKWKDLKEKEIIKNVKEI